MQSSCKVRVILTSGEVKGILANIVEAQRILGGNKNDKVNSGKHENP